VRELRFPVLGLAWLFMQGQLTSGAADYGVDC